VEKTLSFREAVGKNNLDDVSTLVQSLQSREYDRDKHVSNVIKLFEEGTAQTIHSDFQGDLGTRLEPKKRL
jgi:hypothetical protein